MLSAELERALQLVESLPACRIIRDYRYLDSEHQWLLTLELKIEHSSPYVPAQTRWIAIVDDTYPFGNIGFYPANEGGLAYTFPHQRRNGEGGSHQLWRLGKLCLDTPLFFKRHSTLVEDPIGDFEYRLYWHVKRALDWLDAAASERLLAPGDPFELPQLPAITIHDWKYRRLVYNETKESYLDWNKYRECGFGNATLGQVPGLEGVACVVEFTTDGDQTLRTWDGRVELIESLTAIWWLWPQPIVIPPWQTPETWGELREAGRVTGIYVDEFLKRHAASLRRNQKDTILLIGYPISNLIGSEPCEVHWDGILLPRLMPEQGKPPNGYRPNAHGWWRRDRCGPLANERCLEYVRTTNWSSARIQARGRLTEQLCDKPIAIIGVGSLGSMLAELLVRAGATDITLIDGDLIEAGNICRHITTLNDIGKPKVDVVAERLFRISPFIKIQAIKENLPSDLGKMSMILNDSGVIIDCSASDEVITLLARAWWPIPRLLTSFSLGYAANCLFSFCTVGNELSNQLFSKVLAPWLDAEALEWASTGEVIEGAGCWSPLFPARYDDVVLAASICVKELESLALSCRQTCRFRVFKKQEANNGFTGYTMYHESFPDNA